MHSIAVNAAAAATAAAAAAAVAAARHLSTVQRCIARIG